MDAKEKAAEKRRLQAKQKRVYNERARLKAIFKNLDKNTLKTVDGLIKQAAFMSVSLADLEKQINREGFEIEYQNGQYQKGTKQSDAVKTYIAMTKNHLAVISKLIELVPPEEREKSKLAALRDE